MKFSIVTPAWEVAAWLPATIESVLSQAGDFSVEYIVIADASKDNTVAIAKEYERKVTAGEYKPQCQALTMRVIEPQTAEGMYVALNKGFDAATGDIFAWIAGDDVYEPGAFEAVAQVFAARQDIVWLKGITSVINEAGEKIAHGQCRTYRQDWLRMGVYGTEAYHVEQDSVFWRKELWRSVGTFPAYFKSSGDYWLWIRMAQYASLASVDANISCFRKREGQDSRVNAERLLRQKLEARGGRPLGAWIPRFFFWPYFHSSRGVQKILEALYPVLFPFTPRPYLSIKDGCVIEKEMKTFYIQ